MKIGIRKVWDTYKNIAAGRGLLQWIGWWPWAVAAVSAVGTWLWAWIKHLVGPERFVLALVAFASILAVIVFIRLAYLPSPSVSLQAIERLATIRFDYLPISPIEKGWTRVAYKRDGTAKFGVDHDIADSLWMQVTQGIFAMDYTVPVHATLANRLIFTAKYDNSPDSGTMIFALVEVSTKNEEHRKRLWLKFYYGRHKHAFLTPGVEHEHDPTKQLPEQTVYWTARPLKGGPLEFDIDLHEAVKLAIGGQGWIYEGVHKVRLRGNLSISPIEFAN